MELALASSTFPDLYVCSLKSICSSNFRGQSINIPPASSSFLSSAFPEFARPSSSLGALWICHTSDSTFRDPSPDLAPTSSTFFCFPGACSTFFDLQIYSVCLIYSPTFHCQLIMIVLTGEPDKIDFRYETRKLALDLRHRAGQEVQNQKD
jgi:hypothetical protein